MRDANALQRRAIDDHFEGGGRFVTSPADRTRRTECQSRGQAAPVPKCACWEARAGPKPSVNLRVGWPDLRICALRGKPFALRQLGFRMTGWPVTSASMWWLRSHCAYALFLALALVAGFVLHGVRVAQTNASIPVFAMQVSMPEGCDGCDENGKTLSTCSLLCTGIVAIGPAAVEHRAIEASFAYALADVVGVSLREPPDPFPPKSLVLS